MGTLKRITIYTNALTQQWIQGIGGWLIYGECTLFLMFLLPTENLVQVSKNTIQNFFPEFFFAILYVSFSD